MSVKDCEIEQEELELFKESKKNNVRTYHVCYMV